MEVFPTATEHGMPATVNADSPRVIKCSTLLEQPNVYTFKDHYTFLYKLTAQPRCQLITARLSGNQ